MAVDVFVELSIIIVIAVLISALMRLLKQPLIIGYILTGVILSPYFLNIIKSTETISIFSQMGIALLLFIIGLSLSPRVIKEVGMISLITGVGQVIFTAVVSFIFSMLLGFSLIASLYIAIALTLSSTIIIMKLLSDKNDLGKLYAKISIGFLLVQDIIAILLLIFISSFSKEAGVTQPMFKTFFIGIFFIGILIILSKYILPRLSMFFAKSQEFLFLFALGWGLGVATLFDYIGLSLEIGALIAGVILTTTPYSYEISSKMRPLRDFFIILFFILLGSQIFLGNLSQFLIPLILLSLFVLIGNPLIMMIIMGLLGYKKRVSFMTGVTTAQISEFSLILVALGVSVGHLKPEILSFVTLIGLITIGGSSYLILYSEKIYDKLVPYLGFFERKHLKKENASSKIYDILLFGYNRVGYDFLHSFKKLGKKFLIVDYNPEVITSLTKEKIDCRYGDADDVEFLNQLNLKEIKMAVSTIPDFETNSLLLRTIKKINKKAIILVVSHQIDEARKLYAQGASYVIMPHFLGGRYASLMINKYGLSINSFNEEKKKHLNHLKKRKELDHNHPEIERNK